MKASQLLLCTAVAFVCVHANAQWQWLDRDGHKVFSDRAPPIDIPEKNILKRPGKAHVVQQADAGSPPDNAPPGTSAAAPPVPAPKKSELDAKLEEKKKQAEQTEAAKRRTEEARIAKARTENCERARKAKATLDSGVRMATTNAQGEREIMDEAARSAESQRVQAIIATDCK